MILSILLALAAQATELLPADKIILDGAPEAPRTQITEFKCGGSVLRITADNQVRITYNDKPVTGPKAAILLAELSHRGVMYNLEGYCLAKVGNIGLNVVRGERSGTGPIGYWQSYYNINSDAVVITSTGLTQLEADSF